MLRYLISPVDELLRKQPGFHSYLCLGDLPKTWIGKDAIVKLKEKVAKVSARSYPNTLWEISLMIQRGLY
jgi:hypothetical protein